ncbi:hypothetical protein [Nitrososphaera sp.]|uniref:hypothetical protein n=1 Tax=Nitrososphaera sp. TaxID=1971748 RepID=UPI00316BB99F
MLRQLVAAYIGLFVVFAEVFNFKDLEAPALNVEYYPQIRKKSDAGRPVVFSRPALRGMP